MLIGRCRLQAILLGWILGWASKNQLHWNSVVGTQHLSEDSVLEFVKFCSCALVHQRKEDSVGVFWSLL